MPPPASHIVKPLRVVVAAVVAAALDHRRAAELAAPDDQRVVEQAARLQVVEQGGDRLVGVARCVVRRSSHEVAVLVPARCRAV